MISNNFYQNETRTIVPSEQERFIKFQCRARQMIMRDNFGKPDESIIPKLYLSDQKDPVCRIITLIHKLPEFSLLSELMHIAKKTNDPSQRREQAIKLLSSSYYQKHKERIAQVHKTWAKKNVDQGGSIWRKYSRWKRLRNPFVDKEYRIRKKLLL